MQNKLITSAFGICFAIALFAIASGQQLGGGGSSGGGGTPCTTTALSVQYNNAGAFGCVAQMTYNSGTGAVTQTANFTAGNIQTGGDIIQNASNNFTVGSGGGDVGFTSNSGSKIGWAFRSGTVNLNSSSDTIQCWTATAASTNFGGPDGTCDIGFARNAGGVLEIINGTANTYREAKLRSVVIGGTVPGISGCSAGTQTGGATAGTYSSGTSGACTVVLTFAFTAPTGWSCATNNQTTAVDPQRQSASSTTTATITGTTVSGDVINFHCMAY